MDDQFGIGDEFAQLGSHVAKLRLISQKLQRDAVHALGVRVDFALRMHVQVQIAAGELAVHHFQAGKFDDAVALVRIQPGSFGIENNLAHSGLLVGRVSAGWRRRHWQAGRRVR